MTYNTDVPATAQSPGLFPNQAKTNWTRLKTLINANHVFNDTAAADDGAHTTIKMVAQTRPVAPLDAGTNGYLYNVIEGATARLEYFNGSRYYLASTVAAMVSFDSAGSIQSQFNVTSVALAAGIYTVTFTTALPNANYIVQVNGMGAGIGDTFAIYGSVAGNATFGNSVSTGSVKVVFKNTEGTTISPLRGYVTIFSVV